MRVRRALLLPKQLYEYYRSYHAYGHPRLQYMGMVGFLIFAGFYFLRFTRPDPQPLGDLFLRLPAIVLMLLLALKQYWPEKLQRFYIPVSYLALLYCLPFFTVFTGLDRNGGIPALSNSFIMLCFLVLLTDWRNTLVMLLVGSGLAIAVYVMTDPNPRVPMDMVAQLPAYLVIAAGANLFKMSTEQIDRERSARASAVAGSIAHEMRHPLSQLKYSLESMQRALPLPGASQPRALGSFEVDALYRHMAHGEVAVRRGLQVIAMTLDEVNSKALDTAGFVHLSAADATHVAVQEYGYDTEEARGRVSVQVTEDFSFRGDETAYLFVLFNLIKNALHYLPTQPGIHVTITVGQRQVKVRDNGPGIAPEARADLFEPFRSVGKWSGTGLGLAYCRRVLRALGGEISCESTLGEFTEFTLHFPPAGEGEEELDRLAVVERARVAFRGKRLLLVDDDDTARSTTRQKLRRLGAAVDEAPDGQSALQLLAQEPYDLVLIDLEMPVPGGYALAEGIRQGKAPANRHVTIVACTSEPPHVAGVKVRKAGMDGFVAKPCAELPLMRALLQASEGQAAGARRDWASLAGRKVLLADDGAWNRKTLAAYLRYVGVEVVEAEHGHAALAQYGLRKDWDAIVLDINMPGMNGLEVARAIRNSGSAARNVPIVALTAHAGEATVQAAWDVGMNEFITKPVDAELLYEMLRRLVGAPPATAPTRTVRGASAGGSLLDAKRLDGHRQVGMLDNLLSEYVPEMNRLIERLELSVARGEMEESLEILHSLLGMSGEAGAAALHQLVRHFYVPMAEERRWPPTPGWVGQIRTVAAGTSQALRTYGASHPQLR